MKAHTENKSGTGRFRLLLPVCLLVLLFLPSCATTPQFPNMTAANLAGLAPESADEGKLEKATADELLREGLSYLTEGNLPLARIHLLMAVKKDPQSAPAYTGLGEVFALEGRNREAQTAFGKALAIDGGHVPALAGLGRLQRRMGKYAKAEEHLARALSLRPEDPAILTELAITLDGAGKEAEAEAYYRKVVALKPDDAAARNNLGFNHLLRGRYEEAASELRKALALAPTDSRIRNNLAAAYALGGNEEHAFRLLVRTVGEAGAYNNLGYVYMTRGEWAKAEKLFRSALRLNPTFYAKAKSNLEHLERIKSVDSL